MKEIKAFLDVIRQTLNTCQPSLTYVSGLLWPTSPEGQTHTCSTPRPFSSQWGFSWVSSAAPLWWARSRESSRPSYPSSETCLKVKTSQTECGSLGEEECYGVPVVISDECCVFNSVATSPSSPSCTASRCWRRRSSSSCPGAPSCWPRPAASQVSCVRWWGRGWTIGKDSY